MVLKFNKKTEYGLMALKYLAQETQGSPASVRDIAERYQIPYPLLAKVMHRLAGEGYVHSQQGSQGGYVLARDLAGVNIADIVTALEGPWATVECADHSTAESCSLLASCAIIDPMTRLNGQIISFLERVPVTEIIGPAHATPPPAALGTQGVHA